MRIFFDENSESHITKEDIQKMIVKNTIDIIPILFTEEKDLNKLGRPVDSKAKSTLKPETQTTGAGVQG